MTKNRFDLSRYSKNESDQENNYPDWFIDSTITTQRLYKTVITKHADLLKKIQNNKGSKIPLKERTIIKSELSKELNIDASNISSRRQPEIVKLIDDLNAQLRKEFNSSLPRISMQNKTRKDLINLVRSQKKEIKELNNSKISEAFVAALESELLGTQKNLSNQITELKTILKEKNETISDLKEQIRILTVRSVK